MYTNNFQLKIIPSRIYRLVIKSFSVAYGGVSRIIIPKITVQEQKNIVDYVDLLISDRFQNDESYDIHKSELDEIIYELYGLSREDVKYIEHNC